MEFPIEIENTYCEAFDGLFSRLLITARDDKRLRRAAFGSTSLPCTVFNESEGGVERFLSEEETPDGRKGAIIQIWVNYGKRAEGKLEYELGKRIRQGILVVPTTRVFDWFDSDEKIDIMDKVGHCGDGYEFVERRFDREMINIPLMMGEFLIERNLSYGKGIMGGNIWFFCDSTDTALDAGDKAVDAISEVEGAITSFDICSAGSKVETNYPEIGPTTNHPYCPTLRDRIEDSRVPDGVESIPEIVINGISLEVVKRAMKRAIESVRDVEGIMKISAGNYGGRLGRHKIYLRDL
ncbi:MAG TPA: formylmethanofuran--tetrahydromethanopterin N-formyltransferase [Candidatus Altiarchaeales archaeon]|nr:MAG: formylmethanofuran--tetrahydromethanopterin formyltransferase [Candidatus Thorarchaeota archaeon]HDH41536.1 formylmethanofuran--tetrahydromethanopterin N-formyltransferase [Candidatus Altiarchaeales archaeon]